MALQMAVMNTEATLRVLSEVGDERIRQHDRFGQQDLPDGTGNPDDEILRHAYQKQCEAAHREGRLTYAHILREEYGEVLCETDPDKLEAELLQLAAVAVQWIEALRRRRPSV